MLSFSHTGAEKSPVLQIVIDFSIALSAALDKSSASISLSSHQRLKFCLPKKILNW
jgi:hypothetical protein